MRPSVAGGAGRGCMHVDKGWDLSRTGVALIRAEPAPRSRDTLPANNRQLAVYSWIWDVPTLSSRSSPHPTPLHSPHQTWIFKARWDETGSFPYCRFRPRSPLSYFDYSDKDSCRKGGALFYFALQQNSKLLSYYYSNNHMWQKMRFVELMAQSVIASPPTWSVYRGDRPHWFEPWLFYQLLLIWAVCLVRSHIYAVYRDGQNIKKSHHLYKKHAWS